MAFRLVSSAFAEGEEIPRRFTLHGNNVSPPLEWGEAPEGTRSFALLVEDPDAPSGTFAHWILWDIPPDTSALEEDRMPPDGTHVAPNDFGSSTWGGPSPPFGRHRYFFKLFALDAVLGPIESPTRLALEDAMAGHVLEMATLVATYERPSAAAEAPEP
jgi:Raf kinase inhibitor-like YbhB/YbcL family protein